MAVHSAATNTTSTYGWVERAFHWSIAVLMLTAIVLGKMAYDAAFDTDAALARKAWLFSFHKTVGVAIFIVALARILWAISQPRPRPLHGGIEGVLAAVVHWLLYGSLVLVPLLGWLQHSATTGFAPIWWPFGQYLPFVPKDPELAARLAVLHTTFGNVLIGSLILHVVGSIKHSVIDKDLTFARMWRGSDPGPLERSKGHLLPLAGAGAVWAATFAAAMVLTPPGASVAAPTEAAQVEGAANWEVTEGTLSITVTQLGSPVTGSFADWQAAIDFDETPRADGTHGTVEVAISTGSLSLGSVTPQATAADFLATAEFPTANFAGVIRSEGDGFVADGALTIREVEVPLTLPFSLSIDGDVATMTGQVATDRRDFGMGETYPDESSVGFAVTIDVALTAQRAP